MVQVGFLIAMPRPPSSSPSAFRRRLNGASVSNLNLSVPSSSSNLSCAERYEGDSFCSSSSSLAVESKWSDWLVQGELPELGVGISTIPVLVDRD